MAKKKPKWKGITWEIRLVLPGFEELVTGNGHQLSSFKLVPDSQSDPLFYTVESRERMGNCWKKCRFFEFGFNPVPGDIVNAIPFDGTDMHYDDAGTQAFDEFRGRHQEFLRLVSNIELEDQQLGTVILFQIPGKLLPKKSGDKAQPLLGIMIHDGSDPNGSAVGRPRSP